MANAVNYLDPVCVVAYDTLIAFAPSLRPMVVRRGTRCARL